MSLELTASVAFMLSAAMTRLAIPWLARLGAVAAENGRTMHSGTVPQGAGAPLLVAAFAAAATSSAVQPSFMFAVFALAALSFANDRTTLPAYMRLAVHSVVALAYVGSLPPGALAFQGLLPPIADRLAMAFALAWMMNLFNFMDGINGIAGTEAIAIAAGYLLVADAVGAGAPLEPIAAAIAGASAGFLVWNLRRRALVFLGDVGAVPLGFIAGALMIDLATRGYWAAALILPATFVADATLTLAARIIAGERLAEPHRTHFYQRAARGLDSHLAVVTRFAIASAVLTALALLSINRPLAATAISAIVVVALLLELMRCAGARFRSSDSGP